MRFMLNGQATVGQATFWRIDDTKFMERPDYDPIEFLTQPFALINVKRSDEAAVRRLIASWNDAEKEK